MPCLAGGRKQVRLHVQGPDNAEHDRQDAADEDGEEVVDAGAAATEAVKPLQMEPERNECRDERQHVHVLRPGGRALGHGNQAAVKTDRIGDVERAQASTSRDEGNATRRFWLPSPSFPTIASICRQSARAEPSAWWRIAATRRSIPRSRSRRQTPRVPFVNKRPLREAPSRARLRPAPHGASAATPRADDAESSSPAAAPPPAPIQVATSSLGQPEEGAAPSAVVRARCSGRLDDLQRTRRASPSRPLRSFIGDRSDPRARILRGLAVR